MKCHKRQEKGAPRSEERWQWIPCGKEEQPGSFQGNDNILGLGCSYRSLPFSVHYKYVHLHHVLSFIHITFLKRRKNQGCLRKEGTEESFIHFYLHNLNTALCCLKTLVMTQLFICLVTNFCFLMHYCLVILQQKVKLIFSFNEVLSDVQISV